MSPCKALVMTNGRHTTCVKKSRQSDSALYPFVLQRAKALQYGVAPVRCDLCFGRMLFGYSWGAVFWASG